LAPDVIGVSRSFGTLPVRATRPWNTAMKSRRKPLTIGTLPACPLAAGTGSNALAAVFTQL
jgi:hypothetical protein